MTEREGARPLTGGSSDEGDAGSTPAPSASVWLVWTESGEYEQWSRDLRGVFGTRELADAHAKQLVGTADEVEVADEVILQTVPVEVPHFVWSAHIWPDGRENEGGSGWHRGADYRSWSNEITAASGRAGSWHGKSQPDKKDRYIEVVGCDEGAVREEYARLLMQVRAELESEAGG